MQIAILALDGCLHSGITGPRDMFMVADARQQPAPPAAHSEGHDAPGPFLVSVRSVDGTPVQTFGGVPVEPDAPLLTTPNPDVLILPAILGDISRHCRNTALLSALRTLHAKGTVMASFCAGAFLLAAAGLLDGREATTHWNLAADFRERFPKVHLRAERMLVDGGDYLCAGGVTAYLDLTLYLISRYRSPQEAAHVARLMLIDPHREHQTPYSLGGYRTNHGDKAILRVQQWLEAHYAEPCPVSALAAEACLGERTFLRRFRAATGESPKAYLQRLRTDAARRLLESTPLSFEEITPAVGYVDATSFRRMFRQHTGLTPGQYRERFALPASG